MRLNRMVIHNLVSESGEREVQEQLSDSLLPVDARSNRVAEQLTASYRNRQQSYATFSAEPGRPFPPAFRTLVDHLDDSSFLSFSRDMTLQLKHILAALPQARGGYLVYADYNQDAYHFMGIFMVRNTEGVVFRRDENARAFIIDPSIHIDIDKLTMAGRINIQRYNSEPSGNYISFIKQNTREYADYFVRWLAATQMENAKHYTELLYKMTTAITCPSDDQGNQLSRDDFRKQIYDYVDTQPNKTVNLQTMSAHFYGDPLFIPAYLEQNNLPVDTEFTPHSSGMRRFVRVDVKADGIEMKFSRGDAYTKVRVEQDSFVIIESQPFAARLSSVLNET
jgi:nucleoid-associated protein